jgi:hypothetical protein
MKQIVDAGNPINPNSEKILKAVIDKGIPLLDYFPNDDVEEAIFNDVKDEGLSATEIHIAINTIYNSGIFKGFPVLLGNIDYIAKKELNSERSADLARMNEAADEKKARRRRKNKFNLGRWRRNRSDLGNLTP